MSYTSASRLPRSATLPLVREVIGLLGYRATADGLRVPNRVYSGYWFDENDYRSHTGVGLDIYLARSGRITVTTRSRVGRSYWDLEHQNQTIKMLRDLFGGRFTTDAGTNRYWRSDGKPPAPAASGCYLARWTFHNALILAKLYLSHRGLEHFPQSHLSRLTVIDRMNPRLLSNNLLLPYLVAIWEEYFKASFTALLRYSARREALLRGTRLLSHDRLEAIAAGRETVEQAIATTLSFQRPSSIASHFGILDPKLDVGGVLKKPYRRRRVSLFESLEALVEKRHAFVHRGLIDTSFTDDRVKGVLKDFEASVDRVYQRVADHYGWPAERDF